MSMPLPSRRRRPPRRLLLAAAAAAAFSAAAIGMFLLARPPSGTAPGQAPYRPQNTSSGRVPSPTAGGVSTAGWQAVMLDGAPVPVSAADGPARTGGGLASGFADTRAGAVLAAVNIAVRTSGDLGPDIFVPTITGQITGPGAAALLAAGWQEYTQATAQQQGAAPGGPAGPATAAVTAFRLASWSPAAAAVTVTAAATAAGSGPAQVMISLQVRWSGRDWQLAAPAGGAFPSSPAPAPVPRGFTALPGK